MTATLYFKKTLNLSGNQISDLVPLEPLYNLTDIDLSNNDIAYLGGSAYGDDWGLMANQGLGAGDEVDLLGNPLSL